MQERVEYTGIILMLFVVKLHACTLTFLLFQTCSEALELYSAYEWRTVYLDVFVLSSYITALQHLLLHLTEKLTEPISK